MFFSLLNKLSNTFRKKYYNTGYIIIWLQVYKYNDYGNKTEKLNTFYIICLNAYVST